MTDYLYPVPTFISGIASIIDLWGDLNAYNLSSSPEEADITALYADWKAVGIDLKNSSKEVASETDAPE